MLEAGLKHTSTARVGAGNTAVALGSGDMEVFATPAMVALMENAAMLAVAAHLPPGSATVGVSVDVSHIKASIPGRGIRATAELTQVDGRRLTFTVRAFEVVIRALDAMEFDARPFNTVAEADIEPTRGAGQGGEPIRGADSIAGSAGEPQGGTLIGDGTHVRYIVDRAKFLAKL